MRYRIGIELGAGTLGWAALMLKSEEGDLSPGPLLNMGVRVFSDGRDPKDKSPNAAQRRGPRLIRRTRDRRRARGRAMLHALEQASLMPPQGVQRQTLETLDPWVLRARALDEPLTAYEVGRALFHLQQRRGYKTNRKIGDEANGSVFEAIEKLYQRLETENARSLGELFGRPRLEQKQDNEKALMDKGKPLPRARVRSHISRSRMSYDYYPDRNLILDEFDLIWEAQAIHHADCMTQEARENIRDVIAYQRPLKGQMPRRCIFLPQEPRVPKALPSAQYARILEDVNKLRIGDRGGVSRRLSDSEREKLLRFMLQPSSKSAKRSFKAIRKHLSLPDTQYFNLETSKRDYLTGDLTAAAMVQETAWGPDWLTLSQDQQDRAITLLLFLEDEDEVVEKLVQEYELPNATARRVSQTTLPNGHDKRSLAALKRIIPRLIAGEIYADFAEAEFEEDIIIGDSVSADRQRRGESLPYYGKVLNRYTGNEREAPNNVEERFGRLANPTLHIAFNELRKVINDVIKRYGAPTQLVLNLTRELPLSDRGLRVLATLQTKNHNLNQARRSKLTKLNRSDTYQNRLKLGLYEEAQQAFGGTAFCVFSGKDVTLSDLFGEGVKIEHILPLSRTLDDSFSNLVLTRCDTARQRRDETPYEASGAQCQIWEKIIQRAAALPASKAWRFDADAMAQWEGRGGDFAARQLTDKRFEAKLAKAFLGSLDSGVAPAEPEKGIWVVSGRLTQDLRHYAGFNDLAALNNSSEQNRTDYRHHAINALIVALTDRSMLKRAGEFAQKGQESTYPELMKIMAAPLNRYRQEAEDRLRKLTVSHKPDHGYQGAMHDTTAYGLTSQFASKNQQLLVTRKPLVSFTARAQLDAIVDPVLRNRFSEAVRGKSGPSFVKTLIEAGENMNPPVFKVRVQTVMKRSSFVVVKHGKDGVHRKAYKANGNYCYDIYRGEEDKWDGEVITIYEAYQKAQSDEEWWKKPVGQDGRPLIMRLKKGDMLRLDFNGIRRTVYVYKFSRGIINMAEHMEADASKRIRAKTLKRIQMTPSSLQKANAVSVRVSPSGIVRQAKR